MKGSLLSSSNVWLFGKTTDLLAFGGSALLSLGLVALGAATGIIDEPTPTWVWVLCVLGLDVAHVWSTLFRVYLDKRSFRERPWLYTLAPAAAWLTGVAVHHQSSALFWRLLAYFAVFHFVRQQYGWLRLYQRRMPQSQFDTRLEKLTIYTATLFPLFWWHTRLPRGFTWFMEGDFVESFATPALHSTADTLTPAYWSVLAAFVVRQVQRTRRGETIAWGKLQLVLSTWVCWWLGIMALNSDYAFTVTNVIIHAVPYFVLTYRYANLRDRARAPSARTWPVSLGLFLVPLLALAFVEEGLWDRWIWLEQGHLFGDGREASTSAKNWLVPLLALPQLTHYVLDGFIWRAGPPNAQFSAMLRATSAPAQEPGIP